MGADFGAIATLSAALIVLAAAGLVGYSRLSATVAVLKAQLDPLLAWPDRLARIEENTKLLLVKVGLFTGGIHP
jgi:hypothetical protein